MQLIILLPFIIGTFLTCAGYYESKAVIFNMGIGLLAASILGLIL